MNPTQNGEHTIIQIFFCNGSFTLPDLDSDSDSNSEGFPFGYKCYMLNVHIAQILDSDPNHQWLLWESESESESESANVNQPLYGKYRNEDDGFMWVHSLNWCFTIVRTDQRLMTTLVPYLTAYSSGWLASSNSSPLSHCTAHTGWRGEGRSLATIVGAAVLLVSPHHWKYQCSMEYTLMACSRTQIRTWTWTRITEGVPNGLKIRTTYSDFTICTVIVDSGIPIPTCATVAIFEMDTICSHGVGDPPSLCMWSETGKGDWNYIRAKAKQISSTLVATKHTTWKSKH